MILFLRGTQHSQICTDRKQNSGCQGLRGQGNGELFFNEYKVSVGDGEKALEMDSGDGYTTV